MNGDAEMHSIIRNAFAIALAYDFGRAMTDEELQTWLRGHADLIAELQHWPPENKAYVVGVLQRIISITEAAK